MLSNGHLRVHGLGLRVEGPGFQFQFQFQLAAVFDRSQARRLVYHSTLGLRVTQKKQKPGSAAQETAGWDERSGFRCLGSGFRVEGSGC